MSASFNIVYPDAEPESEHQIGSDGVKQLQSLGSFKCHVGPPKDYEEFIRRIKDAHGIIIGWGIPTEVMVAAKNLKVISFTGIGAAKFVDLPKAQELGISVCNTPGYGDRTVAEHALGLLFALAKKITQHDQNTRNGSWSQAGEGFEFLGKTIGIMGFGGIGQQLAKFCEALGLRVLVWTRSADKYKSSHPDVEFVEFDVLLRQSDIVSLHLAHTVETEGMIGARELELMKLSAVLINTARGEIIDEAALCNALESGAIAGAALDVFCNEPLPMDDPLQKAPNTVLTPHVAYATPEATSRIHRIAADNVLQYFSGNPVNLVN